MKDKEEDIEKMIPHSCIGIRNEAKENPLPAGRI